MNSPKEKSEKAGITRLLVIAVIMIAVLVAIVKISKTEEGYQCESPRVHIQCSYPAGVDSE